MKISQSNHQPRLGKSVTKIYIPELKVAIMIVADKLVASLSMFASKVPHAASSLQRNVEVDNSMLQIHGSKFF